MLVVKHLNTKDTAVNHYFKHNVSISNIRLLDNLNGEGRSMIFASYSVHFFLKTLDPFRSCHPQISLAKPGELKKSNN